MFGVGFTELLVIFTLMLVLFGPEKLPELARQLGKIMGELRKHSDGLRREFYNSVYSPAEELRTRTRLLERELTTSVPAPKPQASAVPPEGVPPEGVPPEGVEPQTISAEQPPKSSSDDGTKH